MRTSHLPGILLLLFILLIGGISSAMAAEENQRDLVPGLFILEIRCFNFIGLSFIECQHRV